MYKLLFALIAILTAATVFPGCTQSRRVSTDEEAEKSMDETMNIDTMAESTASNPNAGASAAP